MTTDRAYPYPFDKGAFGTIVKISPTRAAKIPRNGEHIQLEHELTIGQKVKRLLDKSKIDNHWFILLDDQTYLYKDLIGYQMDYYGCCIIDYLNTIKNKSDKPEELSLTNILNWFKTLTAGISFLDNHSIIHCDIRGDNILIDPTTLHVKICDFGLACSRRKFLDDKIWERFKTPCYPPAMVFALSKRKRIPPLDNYKKMVGFIPNDVFEGWKRTYLSETLTRDDYELVSHQVDLYGLTYVFALIFHNCYDQVTGAPDDVSNFSKLITEQFRSNHREFLSISEIMNHISDF